MKNLVFILLLLIFSVPGFAQEELGMNYEKVKTRYESMHLATLELSFLQQRIIVKNNINDYCLIYDFENDKCFREILLFPKIDQDCWIKKIEEQGWEYNKVVKRYSLKKDGKRYFGQISLYPSALKYLAFEMKSGAWIYE
ncbi:MAG: hypothetical protein ACJ75J_05965 [Cytophagaceae bacterium]